MATEFIECPQCGQQIECDPNDVADDPMSRMTNDMMNQIGERSAPRAFMEHLRAHTAGPERDVRIRPREFDAGMEEMAQKMFGIPANEVEAMFARQGMLVGAPTEADMTNLGDDDLVQLVWGDVGTGPEPMRPEHETFWDAEMLNMEWNGGLVQWFLNTRGDVIPETRAALAAIGAQHHLAVFDRAVEIYEREKLLPDSWWIEELDDRAYESEIEQLDDEFGTVSLAAVEAAYIRAHADAFLA